MPDTILITTPQPHTALIQLNRPERLNALNQQVFDDLTAAYDQFATDDSIRVVVITGSERAFAAGADVTEMQGRGYVDTMQSGEQRMKQWRTLTDFPKPVIAAVNGWCLGGGNELAMSADMLIAGENAQFGQPEINLAIMPGGGGTQRLTHAVGKVTAMEMMLAARFLSAREAYDLGLVNRVVPVAMTIETALELAAKVASMPPLAAQAIKGAVLKAFDLPLTEGIRYERNQWYSLFATEDKEEGITAFLDKRDPNWKGR